MAEFNLKLTQGGAILLAKAKLGKQLNFKYITLGSGVYEGNPQEATAFVNKVIDLNIQEKTRKDTVAFLKATLTYNAVPDGFVWTELGVIAIDPDTQEEVLYMYDAIDMGEVIPPATSATQIEKVIQVASYVSNAPNISVVIDESLINIPRSDVGKPNGIAPLNEDGVLDIQYGGTGAKTKKQACDNLDAMSAVCAYYSGEDSDGILDTSTESTIIIPITRDINADLYNLIGGNWGYVYQTFFDEKTTATRRVQLVISTGTGKIACRQYDITLQKWQDWTVQATTQKPIEHDLALADGFIANHGCKYFKTQDNVVTLFLDTRNTSLFGPQETVIATLPSGFRPIKALTVPGTCVAKNADTGQYQPCVGKLYTNGNISIYTATTNTPLEYAVISCSFVAGN